MSHTHATGCNVLIRMNTEDEKTGSGLIIPDHSKESKRLSHGIVVEIGPGFLIPFPKEDPSQLYGDSDLAKIVDGTSERPHKPVYIPMDIQVGDTAYFPIEAAYEARLEGQTLYVLPYSAILLFDRKDR